MSLEWEQVFMISFFGIAIIGFVLVLYLIQSNRSIQSTLNALQDRIISLLEGFMGKGQNNGKADKEE